MRRYFSAVVLAFSLLAVGCGETATTEPGSASSESTAAAAPVLADVLTEVQDGSGILLDVRTAKEWGTAHFANAVHIPLADISADKTATLEKTKPIYVHCAAGKRAVTGAEELKNLGFNAIAL